MKKKTLIYMIIFAPMLAMILSSGTVYYMFSSGYSGQNAQFSIKPGEGFASINQRLFTSGLITNRRVFHYYTKYKNKMTSFKAGTYTIKNGDAIPDVFKTLIEGSPILTSVTIPEGKNMFEIARIFESKKISTYSNFITLARDVKMREGLNIDAPSLEGYLFPETYMFAPGTQVKTIIRAMLRVFKNKVKNINFDHPFLSKHQIITLASIVEKETGAKKERPTIAGVFLNRLKKKMRLQSDPTTIYGIYESYKGNIRKKHLLQKTPYNTYKIPALPLGPIANPSIEAIKAVLNPEAHGYLYFVSKNDGTHVFTKTYKDHLEAVKEWQLKRRNRKGKSWRDLKQ